MFDFDRFKELCVLNGLKVSFIESRLNLYHGFFNNVRTGKNSISDNLLTQVAALLDTTSEYLTDQTDDPSPQQAQGVKIKVFGSVAAGIPIQQIENFDPDDSESWEEIDRRTAKNGTYFALRIKGDSMEPRMFEGDTVIVRHQNTAETGDCAIVAINGDTATCKRIRIDPNGIYLIPLNNKYDPKFFSNEEIESLPITILGKVVEVRGKL